MKRIALLISIVLLISLLSEKSFGYSCNYYSGKMPEFSQMTSTMLYTEITEIYNDGVFLEKELIRMGLEPPRRLPNFPDNFQRMRRSELVRFASRIWTLDSTFCAMLGGQGLPTSQKKVQPIFSLAGFLRGETNLDFEVESGLGFGGRVELSLATIIDIGDYFDVFFDVYVPKLRLKSSQAKLTDLVYAGGVALKPPRFKAGPVSLGCALGFGFYGCDLNALSDLNQKSTLSGFLGYVEGNIVHVSSIPMGIFISYSIYDPWDDMQFQDGIRIRNLKNSPYGAVSVGIRISPWVKSK
ncbi:MAG: hypothetical protein N2319_01995 [Candidatus Kapabacteria bacterium]|nr:hypothetical protein [Candidatus Kapabacteria bacterium]